MIEIEPYRALWKREEQDNKELREIIEYKEQKIERQKEIIKQLDIKNLELTTIIKEVREYIQKNCILSNEWTELDFCNFIPTGKITYKQLTSKKVKGLLEILDKVGDEK